MRHFKLIFLLIVSIFIFISSIPASRQVSVKDQDKLMKHLINYPMNIERNILKQDLIDISRSTKVLNNSWKITRFLNKLLKTKKFRNLRYYIFLKLAELNRKEEKLLIERAMNVSSSDRERLECLVKLYEFHKKKGDIKKEILYLKKQAVIKKRTGDKLRLKQIYATLGDYHMRENNLIKSLQNLFEAKKYSDLISEEDSGFVYYRIAKVFSLLQRKKLTIKYLSKSLNYARKFGMEDLRMKIFNDYATLHLLENKYNNANYYNNLSLKIAKKNNFTEIKLKTDFIRSQIFFNTGKEIDGLRILKVAVDSGIKTESFNNLFLILCEFIRRTISYGNLKMTSSYLQQFDEIYAPFYKGYFFYYFLNGELYEKKGDLNRAKAYYDKAFNNLEFFFSELKDMRHYPFKKEIKNIYSEIARFNFKMFDLTNNVKFLKKAVFAGEVKNPYMFRRTFDSTGFVPNIISEKKKIEKTILITQRKLNTKKLEGKKKNIYRKKIHSLKNELTELDDLLFEAPKRYKRFLISDFDISSIQKNLENDSVIIRFIVLEKDSYAFIIDKKHAGFKKFDKGSKYIKEITNSLLNPIESYANGNVDFLRAKFDPKKAKELFDTLLYEILEFQKDKKKLIIIPDNILFRIPFEALVTNTGNGARTQNIIFSEYESVKFLVDDYSIEYFLSLFHYKKVKKSKKKTIDISAFGFPDIKKGNKIISDLFDVKNIHLNQLHSAGKEIENIKKIWGLKHSRYFTGNDFTKKNFRRIAPHSRIVHLATHFISNREYPWQSVFLFSHKKNKDPFFYASDMSKLKLDCDLIFLSTCGSLEKHLLGEQLISGVTAALYNSGAESMIASLWPVNEFSSELISPFYTALRKKPKKFSKFTELLRSIKLSFRRKRIKLESGQEISFSHPLIWANFNIYKFHVKK